MAKTTARRRFSDPVEGFKHRTEWVGDCLEYTGHRDKDGYGKLTARGKGMLAHRFAWELEHGPIPDGMKLDHRCHNPACCNTKHLRLATQKQNMEHQTRAHKGTKSGVRGVYWQAQRGKWAAQVRHNGTSHYLGLFDDVGAAAAVVKAKRLDLFTHNDADREAA